MDIFGIGSALGGLFGMGGTIASAGMALKDAQRNRDFQERMSNTAHQRQVADLRKAGLNPILTATGGGGASVPSGATASIPDIGASVNNAVQGMYGLKKTKADIKNVNQNTAESLSRENVNNVTQLKLGAEMNNLYEQGLNLQAQREQIFNDIQNSKTLTNAQAFNLMEGGKFSKRRSGGYSESSSGTSSRDGFKGIHSGPFGKVGTYTGGYTENYSRSKSW